MKITSDQVKEVQQGVHVTYEEAEKYLYRTNGDVDAAITLLIKKKNSTWNKFLEEANRLFKEALTYNFKVSRHEEIVVDLPFVLIIGLLVMMDVDAKVWVTIISIGLILISESHVMVYKRHKKHESEEGQVKMPESRDDGLKEARVKPEVKEEEISVKEVLSNNSESGNDLHESPEQDDDYYEITIEK